MDKSGLTSSTSSSIGGTSDGAIYYGMAPSKKIALQIFFICVGIGVVASLVVCFVLSNDNRALYLLGVNQCITLVNCLVLLRWYLKGTLPANWLWYLVLVGLFLLIQSAITDIMVGEYPYSPATIPPPTLPPTRPPGNHTNGTTHIIPTTHPNGTNGTNSSYVMTDRFGYYI